LHWRCHATAAARRCRHRWRACGEDLLSAVFPDQLACAENLPGELEIPDHPLVRQTIRDCLEEAMDIGGLERLLRAWSRAASG